MFKGKKMKSAKKVTTVSQQQFLDQAITALHFSQINFIVKEVSQLSKARFLVHLQIAIFYWRSIFTRLYSFIATGYQHAVFMYKGLWWGSLCEVWPI